MQHPSLIYSRRVTLQQFIAEHQKSIHEGKRSCSLYQTQEPILFVYYGKSYVCVSGIRENSVRKDFKAYTVTFFKQLIEFGCPKSMSQNRTVCQYQYGPEPAPLVVPLT